MIKHKKVTRTLLAVFMALCLFMGPLASKPKAEEMTWEYNFYHVSNSIRATCSGYRETTANYYVYNDPTNLKYRMVIEVDFGTDAVTGSFTLGLSQIARGDVVLCQGCTMTSNLSSTSVTFSVNGTNYCRIEVYSASSARGLVSFTGSWQRYTSQELTALNQIKAYIDGVETSLTTISNTLSTISTNLTTTNSLLAQIDNILKIQTFPIWQQNVLFWANKMGDLQFDKQMPYFYYNAGDNTNAASNPKRIKIDPGKTVSLIFYCDSNVTNSNYHIYGSQVANVTAVRSISSIVPTYPLYLIKLDFTSSYTTSVFINIEFDNSFNLYPLFLGDNNLIPEDICILFGIEYSNTYTRLLQQISSGISNLGNDQTVIDQSTNTTNNFNTEITKINNIEVNILSGINSKFTDVNTAIDQSGVINGSINNTGIGWANYYSGVVLDNLTIVKYPVYIILIGFVLLCLLG